MKILFPIKAFYPSQVGGPCNSVYYLAKGIAKEGHDVLVLTTNYGIKEKNEIETDKITMVQGIKVIYSTPSFITNIAKLFAPRASFPKNIGRHIKSFSPDIIHLSSLFDPLAIMCASVARKKEIPYVWSSRGELAGTALKDKALKKRFFLSLSWFKKLLVSTAMFHVTSEEEGMWLENLFSSKIGKSTVPYSVIPNMVDDDIFNKKPWSGFEKKYPEKYILYLGRISREKNIESLIRAFANKSIVSTGIKLVIAGWLGGNMGYARELRLIVKNLNIEKEVVFTESRVEGTEKRALYRNAELFVLPSHCENFGMVTVESLAQGTPVVASKGTPWKALKDKECGYWIKNDDVSLRRIIVNHFLVDRKNKKQMGENAIQFSQKFSISILTERYTEIYEKVLKINRKNMRKKDGL